MNGKVSVVFNRNRFPKMKYFFKVRPLSGSQIHRKCGSMKEIVQDTYILLHTTNRKYYMTYRFVLVRWLWMILDDLVAGLSKCNSTNTCTAFRTVSTDTARRAVPRRQLTELLVYINDVANCDMNTDLWFRCCERASDVNLSILRVVWKCEYNKSVHTLTIRSQPYAHCAYIIANHFTTNTQMTCNCMYHSTDSGTLSDTGSCTSDVSR